MKAIPANVLQIAVNQRRRGKTLEQIAENLDISVRSVTRALRNVQTNGTTSSLASYAPRGPTAAWTPAHASVVEDIVKTNPTFYLDELVEEIYSALGITASTSMISRMLTSRGLTRKKLQVLFSQAVLADQQRYCNLIRSQVLFSNKIIALDETYKNDRTGLRTHGRAEKGERAYVHYYFCKGQRYSCVGFLTFGSGMLRPYVVKCTVNTMVFTQAVRQRLLSHINAGDIVIADNASHHHDDVWITDVTVRGGRVIFLPPYSPMFNPIEKTFGIVKAWLKRHSADEAAFPGTGEAWLEYAFTAAVGPEEARACFRGCTHPDIADPDVYPYEL